MRLAIRSSILATLLTAWVLPACVLAGPQPSVDTIKRSFQVSPGGTLQVDIDFGNVIVESSGDGMVYVELQRTVGSENEDEAKRLLARHEWEIDQVGNDVVVESRYEFEGTDRWINRNRRDNVFRLKVVVRIPDEYSVDFTTGAGNVSITDVGGWVEGTTGAGNITIGEVTGSVEIRSGSGNIDIAGIDGSIEVTSGAGNVTLGYVTGEIQANTGAGNIEARITRQPGGDSSVETGAGNVTVYLGSDVGMQVDARASVGSAECDFGLKVSGKWMSKSFEGDVNGGGPALTMRSGVGNVALKRI